MNDVICAIWERLERRFSGHVSWGRLCIYGFNAMHVAVNFWTRRWGYLCFHPTMYYARQWWPWYFYISPNATPWCASFAIGPGVYREDKGRAKRRRWIEVYRRMEKLEGQLIDELEGDPGAYRQGIKDGFGLAMARLMERD